MNKARRVSVVTRSKGRCCHHFRYVKVGKGSVKKNARAGRVKLITRFLSAVMLSIREPDCSKKTLLSLSELSFLSVFTGTFRTDNLSFTNTFGINRDGYYLDKVVLESLRVTGNIFSVPPASRRFVGKKKTHFTSTFRAFQVRSYTCCSLNIAGSAEMFQGFLFTQSRSCLLRALNASPSAFCS